MTFQKGQSGNPNGREKGSHNQFTSLKDSFVDAFKSDELNGTEGLITWAKKSDRNRATFYQMITKMLPTNVDVGLTGNLNTDKPVLVNIVKTHIEDQDKEENANPGS